MALLELILSACLQPAPEPQKAPQGPPPAAKVEAEPAAVAALQDAVKKGADGLGTLAGLAAGEDAGVAARAAWQLGRSNEAAAVPLLADLAQTGKNAEVRVHAMAALLRLGNAGTAPVGVAGLDDADRRVRTLAAQLLGRLRRPDDAGALLAFVDRSCKREAGKADAATTPTDVQAAILALHDMEATARLLPVATAVQQGKVNGLGEVLTFTFQDLSPKLPRKEESTLLLAVLDHQELLLRRYAIARLGELADPQTAPALERRLANEGPELRPLLEVALRRARGQQHGEANAEEAGNPLVARWHTLSAPAQGVAVGCGALALVAAVSIVVVMRRRRSVRVVAAAGTPRALDLVAPSDEYLAELEADAEQLASTTEETSGEVEQFAELDEAVPAETAPAGDEPDAVDLEPLGMEETGTHRLE